MPHPRTEIEDTMLLSIADAYVGMPSVLRDMDENLIMYKLYG